MQIKFYGTSHGYPEPHRHCSCTMITVGEKRYLIDCGAPIVDLLRTDNIPLADINAIFITHRHGDHTIGLLQYIYTVSWIPWKSNEPDPAVFLPERGIAEAITHWVQVTKGGKDVNYIFYEEGEIYNDGSLKVTAIQTQHTERSFSFLVEAEGRKVLFTGDLKGPNKDLPRIAFEEKLDAVVCEAAHFAYQDHEKVFESILADRIYVNHIQLWREESVNKFIAEHPSCNMTLTQDGMVVEL